MSTNEILAELPHLPRIERARVWRLLEELELGSGEENSEMLAAIDAGVRSMREGKSKVEILRIWHAHRDPSALRLS